MATVLHDEVVSGKDERSSTLRSATTPFAYTWAPPSRSTVLGGHEVVATRTVPTGGSGAETTAVAEITLVAAIVPAGPLGPAGPGAPAVPGSPRAPTGPAGPGGPWAPRGPAGPEEVPGIVASAAAPMPTPARAMAPAPRTAARLRRWLPGGAPPRASAVPPSAASSGRCRWICAMTPPFPGCQRMTFRCQSR